MCGEWLNNLKKQTKQFRREVIKSDPAHWMMDIDPGVKHLYLSVLHDPKLG
jgi:hypothetical protein